MRSKNISVIFAVFSIFASSTVLFGSDISKFRMTIAETRTARDEDTLSEHPDWQINIRRFLVEDQLNGYDFYAEIKQNKGDNKFIREAPATARLVVKMQKMNCSGMPSDFCKSWNDHLAAWKNMSDLLNRVTQKSGESDKMYSEYSKNTDEARRTYQILLIRAKKYGVDFSF